MTNRLKERIRKHGITLHRWSGFSSKHPLKFKTIKTHSQYYFDRFIGKLRLKMINFDLDGTILNDEKEIHPNNLSAIETLKKKNPNIMINIVTGKGFHQAKRFADKMKVKFLITDNGGAIFERKNGEYELLKAYTIPEKESLAISKKINEFFIENPDMICHLSTPDNFIIKEGYFEKANDVFYPNEPFGDGVIQVKNFEEIKERGLSNDIIKICVDFSKSDVGKKQCDKFKKYLKDNHINYFPTTDSKFEIAPEGVNKGNAILEIVKTLKKRGILICLKEIVNVGDGINDVSMCKSVFQCFTPRNGELDEIVNKIRKIEKDSYAVVNKLKASNNDPIIPEIANKFETHTTPYLIAKLKEAKTYVRDSLSTKASSNRKRERKTEREL